MTTPAVVTPPVSTPAAAPTIVGGEPPVATSTTPAAAAAAPVTPGAPVVTPAPAPVAPPPVVTYDLKAADGTPLDAARAEKFVAYAKEHKLSNEQAQAVLNRENDAVSSYQAAVNEQFKQRATAWVEEVKSDKEFGGENFAKNAELVKRVVERFGNENLKKTLNETGLGNYPELFSFVTRIGKAFSEDQLVMPGSQPAGNSIDDVALRLYPSSKPKE